MNRPWAFGLFLFLAVWVAQLLLTRWSPPGVAVPQLPLLTVLALGGTGWTNLAQTLGFFWGLSLDVMGVSLFGGQGLLLAVAGFSAGRFSRQLNAEKSATQQALAFFGTAFFWVGLAVVERLFRTDGASRPFFTAGTLWHFVFNALAAPVVFWATRGAVTLWLAVAGGEGVHD